MVSTSDWVLIVYIFILVTIALFGLYTNELRKRKKFVPKLKIDFKKEYPYIVKPAGDNFYSINFGVVNEGNSKAINCEAIIEEFHFENKKGNLIKDNNIFPALLAWAAGLNYDYSPTDILPKAVKFIHIFYIATSANSEFQGKLIFSIKMGRVVPLSKSRILLAFNNIKIKIVIYSGNAKKCEQYIEINVPGIKRDNKKQNLQELQIKLT